MILNLPQARPRFFLGRWLGRFFSLGMVLGLARAEPIITEHPRGQLVFSGGSAGFVARCVQTNGVAYQWLFNGQPVPQADQAHLLVSAVSAASAGDYSVILRDPGGSVTSRVATLTVDVPRLLIPLTGTWKYWAHADPPGADWMQPGFVPTTWTEGTAVFHRESSPLPLSRGTALPIQDEQGAPIPVHYFRTWFNFEGNPAGLTLMATAYVDDGAVFYLNGREIGRLRLPDGPLEGAAPASPAREGIGRLMIFPASELVAGENVLAVEVRQHADAEADVVFGLSLQAAQHPPPMPDLMPWGPAVRPWIEEEIFAANDCAVNEGCAAPGLRRILRFTTETRNVGDASLFIGSPASNPEFVFDPCHFHYHFDDYIRYRLLNAGGKVVVDGGKRSFCLEDSDRWDLTLAATREIFQCTGAAEQGIQAGWSDIYDSVLPCQYLDITDLAPGAYELELAVDPEHRLPEKSRGNNLVRVPVEIPANWQPCTVAPDNDDFAAAHPLPAEVTEYRGDSRCATRQAGDPIFGALPALNSVWFRWTAPRTGRFTVDTDGSHFATLLGVYEGNTLETLQALVADNVGRGPGFSSRVVPYVTAGTEYRICVASAYFGLAYRAGQGEFVLHIGPADNDLYLAPQELRGARGSVVGDLTGAGRESGEPFHAGEPGGRSRWYVWTATEDANVLFEAIGYQAPPLLGVYPDAPITALEPMGNPRESSVPRRQQLPVQVQAGKAYRMAIDSRDAVRTEFELRWRPRLELRLTPGADGEIAALTVLGLAGDPCLLETSTDLNQWVSDAVFDLKADEATRAVQVRPWQRFFRVRLVR